MSHTQVIQVGDLVIRARSGYDYRHQCNSLFVMCHVSLSNIHWTLNRCDKHVMYVTSIRFRFTKEVDKSNSNISATTV